jgi:hypothetical protein
MRCAGIGSFGGTVVRVAIVLSGIIEIPGSRLASDNVGRQRFQTDVLLNLLSSNQMNSVSRTRRRAKIEF